MNAYQTQPPMGRTTWGKSADRWETKDLAGKAEHADVLQRLRAALVTQKDELGDCGERFRQGWPSTTAGVGSGSFQ